MQCLALHSMFRMRASEHVLSLDVFTDCMLIEEFSNRNG